MTRLNFDERQKLEAWTAAAIENGLPRSAAFAILKTTQGEEIGVTLMVLSRLAENCDPAPGYEEQINKHIRQMTARLEMIAKRALEIEEQSQLN